MRNKSALSTEIARVAKRQHGIVTLRQLEEAGITRAGVARRAERGQLHRVHQGVYAVGYPPSSQEAWWMAAVLACGDGAVLSHMSAAALWDLLNPQDGPIHISLPSQSGRRRRERIRIHRCPSLAAGNEVTKRRDIPVTSVPRTLTDLRRSDCPERLLRRATRQAELRKFALPAATPARRTRSDLEDDFLVFLRHHHLPLPEVNVKLGRWEADFLWRPQRLVVETDFYDTHRGTIAFEDDHQRDLDFRRLGYRVRRYTGAQLRNHPAQVVADLGEVLGV
ncbi:MAG TPA: type IV toxin-antitoxin system AbiEi family antitoxin domain-containing protein [Solirubrobacterales bacterium]|nr:type IV toxin-antitoxin system AbiEi family antitoxin domain-containing protein [Solirubrobacterales bacterium]